VATITVDKMLPALARVLGVYVGSFTVTTDINADDQVVSTGLPAEGWTVDDQLNEMFVRITSHANNGVIRFIEDYESSTGALTVSGANLANDSSDTASFEIYRVNPNRLIEALNDGADQAYPTLFRLINDSTLTLAPAQTRYARPTTIRAGGVRQVYMLPRIEAKTYADNIANDLNVDLENAALDDWTATNATIAIESETTDPDNFMVYSGEQSMKITVGASSINTVLLSITNPTNYIGQEINVSMWVYSKTASRVSLGIEIDDGTIDTGSTHTGNGWERLTHTVVGDSIDTKLEIGLHVTSSTAFVFYADEIIVTAGQSEIPQSGRDEIWDWYESGDNIVLRSQYSDQRNLLIVGMGELTSISATGSSTMELEDEEARQLYYNAAQVYLEGRVNSGDGAQQNQNQRTLTMYRNRAESGVGMMIPPALMKRP
jgi:hypothetical protein